MTKHLAVEWGPLGIRVNAIAPGPIDNTIGMSKLAPGDFKKRMESVIPMRRFGRIDEIADAAVYLSSSAADYITGAILVDSCLERIEDVYVNPHLLWAKWRFTQRICHIKSQGDLPCDQVT